MPGLATPPVSLLYIVLLLVPGVIALDLYLRTSKKIGDLSRTNHPVYSVGISLLSVTVLYLSTPITYPVVTWSVNQFTSYWPLLTSFRASRLGFADVLVFYILQISGAVLIGALLGRADRNWFGDGTRDRRDPWGYAFGEVPRDGESVLVTTTDGSHIWGSWNETAFTQSKRELYLDEPQNVSFDNNDTDGASIKDSVELGRGIYLHEDDVARVAIPESDPDSLSYDSFQGNAETKEDAAEGPDQWRDAYEKLEELKEDLAETDEDDNEEVE